MPQTVIILPETNETTLCLRLTGTVTADDFTTYFGNEVMKRAGGIGWYNLYLLHDENFEGWSPEAADLSFRNISEFSPKARRLAYVNAPDSRMLMMKMLKPMMKAETRFFELDQQAEAMTWMMSYKP